LGILVAFILEKVDVSNERFARVCRIKDRKRRFEYVWDLCKGKALCDATEESEDHDPRVARRHNHGGCGQRQPVYRKEGLKLNANFKAYKDEVRNPPHVQCWMLHQHYFLGRRDRSKNS
jgi:hypothetical protein